MLTASAAATRHQRAAERKVLGRNIAAAADADDVTAADIPDPAKVLMGTSKNEGFGVKLGVLGDLRGPRIGFDGLVSEEFLPHRADFFLQAPNPGRWVL